LAQRVVVYQQIWFELFAEPSVMILCFD